MGAIILNYILPVNRYTKPFFKFVDNPLSLNEFHQFRHWTALDLIPDAYESTNFITAGQCATLFPVTLITG